MRMRNKLLNFSKTSTGIFAIAVPLPVRQPILGVSG
jgi:hypothetical protein